MWQNKKRLVTSCFSMCYIQTFLCLNIQAYSKDQVNLNSSIIPFLCFVREHFWANFRASSTTSLSVILQLIKNTNYLTCIYLCGQNKVTFKSLKSCGSCSKLCSTHIRFILRKRFLRGAPEVPRGGEPLVSYEEASSCQLATHTHSKCIHTRTLIHL